jgi:hypothetical protein
MLKSISHGMPALEPHISPWADMGLLGLICNAIWILAFIILYILPNQNYYDAEYLFHDKNSDELLIFVLLNIVARRQRESSVRLTWTPCSKY